MLVFLQGTCKAQDVNFIYIHGTNDNNYAKKQEFSKSVAELHPYIKKAFENDPLAKKHFLRDGYYVIDSEPIAFYWGDRSKEDLNLMVDWLDITKFFSPKLAQSVRSTLTYTLHDAIWIQKYNNMRPVVRNLHSIINYSVDQNEDKFVLFGHSAGSFITFEYLLYKLPMIDPIDFLRQRKVSEARLMEYKKIYSKNTCVDGLLLSGIANYLRDGSFVLVDRDHLTENYKNMANVTKDACVADGSLKGIVLFGTPVTLFYSGFNMSSSKLYLHLLKYIIENNMFLISVNYAEDPLGFPISTNDNYDLIATFQDKYDCTIKPNHGFLYDKSNIRSNKFVASAHTSYWKTPKLFSKSIIEAYNEGYGSYYVNAIRKKETSDSDAITDLELLQESKKLYTPQRKRIFIRAR